MAKNKGGRPTIFSKALANEICQYIADGYSLREIEEMEGMPSKTQILKWATDQDKTEFTDQYAQAMQRRTEYWAEEILAIADNGENDWMERNDKDNPGYAWNGEGFQRSRLRIDSRKWLMSKLAPKKYGDRIEQQITGKDGESIIPIINIKLKGDE